MVMKLLTFYTYLSKSNYTMLDVLIENSRVLMWKMNNIVDELVSRFEIEFERGWDTLIHTIKIGVDSSLLTIENTCYGDLNRYINCRTFTIKLITENKEIKLDRNTVEKDEKIKQIVEKCITKIRQVNEHLDKVIEVSNKLTEVENTQQLEELKEKLNKYEQEIENYKNKLSQYEEEIKKLQNKLNELNKQLEELKKIKEKLNNVKTDEIMKIINEFKEKLNKPSFIKAIGGNYTATKLNKIITTLENLLTSQ